MQLLRQSREITALTLRARNGVLCATKLSTSVLERTQAGRSIKNDSSLSRVGCVARCTRVVVFPLPPGASSAIRRDSLSAVRSPSVSKVSEVSLPALSSLMALSGILGR